MPNFAVLNGQIITTEDIYKFNIPKTSEFICFTCEKKVQFRQQRNADNNFIEHFYHPNTVKDTHIECEKAILERDTDTWHNTISNFIQRENREIIRKRDDIKHIVDAYDEFNDMGIEFQNSPISVEAIQSRDATTYLDWIFNVENQYLRKVSIGNFVVCEIPHDNWENAVKAVKNSVYLYTGYNEWVLLETRENYHIEIEKKIRNVWIGKQLTFQEIYHTTCLQNILTREGFDSLNSNQKHLDQVPIIYARCKQSMYLLDSIHRDYVYKHIFQKGEIMAIKSVAGSGKTTTLLELAKIHKTKKILYLAFNRSLISEIKIKLNKEKITNMYPYTFDSLLRNTYIKMKNSEPNITYITPQTIQNIIPWLKGKAFPIRKDIIKLFSKFCGQYRYSTIEEYCKYIVGKDKPLLETLWKKCLSFQVVSFESMRKLSVLQHWFKNIIDTQYDMIMIDETQDFDIMMLRMILDDTTIPKIFVGDPKQSIYEWRGCINGFNYMPSKTLIVEFYSTFRIGEPACEEIRKRFDHCWMISKSKNETILSKEVSFTEEDKYTYLFRSWKRLLQTATNMKNIWISGYDEKIESIRRQHQILQKGYGFDDDEFEDDLPNFLRSITYEELETMIAEIEENIVMKDNCSCKFYTIHSYKGLEDDNIRISDDIHMIKEDNDNIYYVALTRGMKYIIED